MTKTPTRALLYTRVSTDEQADRGFSLRDQEARLRAHCRREGVCVVRHYQDDASAKTFDRPAFQELLTFVEKNRGALDTLFVVKWDRFSRDATGALSMIRRLEERGVRVQAIEQPVDLDVPEQLIMLAIYVAAPEVENRRRSIATKQGMRRAMREGRFCNRVPKGYRRERDERDQAIIVPGEDALSSARRSRRPPSPTSRWRPSGGGSLRKAFAARRISLRSFCAIRSTSARSSFPPGETSQKNWWTACTKPWSTN